MFLESCPKNITVNSFHLFHKSIHLKCPPWVCPQWTFTMSFYFLVYQKETFYSLTLLLFENSLMWDKSLVCKCYSFELGSSHVQITKRCQILLSNMYFSNYLTTLIDINKLLESFFTGLNNCKTIPSLFLFSKASIRAYIWSFQCGDLIILRFWVFLDFSLLFSTFLLLLRICWREFYSGNDPHLNQVSSRQHLVVLFSLLKVLAYGCDILECYLVACYIFKLLCASTFKKKW